MLVILVYIYIILQKLKIARGDKMWWNNTDTIWYLNNALFNTLFKTSEILI